MNKRLLLLTALSCLVLLNTADAKSRKRKKTPAGGGFSYYLLSLSYAPDFCAQPVGDKDPRECGIGRHIGFVVHGLWPQADTGKSPERCGPASPVSQQIIQATLKYIPSESLIQHEWTNHGTCSGLSAADYFAAVRTTRDELTIPPELDQPTQQVKLSPAAIEAKLAAANPTFPKESFRLSCYNNGQLKEARICVDKDLKGRACTASAGACNAGSVILLPVR